MKIQMMKFNKFILDLLLPNRCPCCDKFIKWDKFICEDCISKIEYTGNDVCNKCGKSDCICQDDILYYDGCITIGYYDGVVKDGIFSFKYNRGLNFIKYFADKIYTKLNETGIANQIDIITSVPMTHSSKSERGYNQAYEISKVISKAINKPCLEKILIKQYDNVSQHSLSSDDRREAVKGLFISNKKHNIKGKTILLCDDVLTTGSTINECCRILKNNGAIRVFCVTIATTQKKIM